MRTRLKVCCISSVEEARIAVAAGADALGLVAEMPSGPGPIADELIAEITATVPPPVATFLLTCRTDPDGIVEHVRACRTNTVQLVDSVPVATYAALRRHCPSVKIVQVLHVLGDRTVEEAREAAPHVDALLLDSGRPDLAVKELGGTGRVHDWATSARIVAAVDRPVFLAGGLTPANIGQAIAQVRPYGVDLCSGVRNGGDLDPAKLAAFVAALMAA
ncbi:phosphoribosylanthranilate isomerase [Indioceanicola profundi]|uniref:phosphoribosylanthranilate isomerase n=1 Tax=Indioceanicola profundi TaxID=2220096 RepID=UPI000E6AAB55|nr:phosphoribosylanthranilate isomerase [Indioceanicola profundi]